MILSCIYILLHKKQRRAILRVPYGKVLIGFFGISALLSAYYGNRFGIVCCFGIFTIYVCAFYLRSVMTYSLFCLMMDTACAGSVLAALFAIYQKLSQYSTMPTYRPESFFLNPNYYGAIIEFIVIIAIYRADINSSGRPLCGSYWNQFSWTLSLRIYVCMDGDDCRSFGFLTFKEKV